MNSLCIKYIYGQKVTIINNLFKEGLCELLITSDNKENVMSIVMTSNEITITLEYGKYTVSVVDDEEDNAITFYILEDSNVELFNRCVKVNELNVDDAAIKKCRSEIMLPNSDIVTVLMNNITKSSKQEDSLLIFYILQTILSYINKRLDAYNSTNIANNMSIDLSSNILTLDASCDFIMQHNTTTKEMPIKYEKDVFNLNKSIFVNDDNMYLYELYVDGNISNVLYLYVPNQYIREKIWSDKYERISYAKAIAEKEAEYPAQYLDFNDYEKTIIVQCEEANTLTPLFKRPIVTPVGDGKINIQINDYDKLMAVSNTATKFYVGFCMIDEVNDKTTIKQRIDITSEDFNIDMVRYNIYNEDYFFYICNSSDEMYSNVEFLNLLYEVDEDFNERLRKLELYNYNKHLHPFAAYKNFNQEEIYEAYNTCESDEVTCSNDIANNIINLIANRKYNYNKMAKFQSIMYQDKIMYGNYVANAYNSPFYYKKSINTITLPPATNILFVVLYSKSNEDSVEDYFMSIYNSAIDVKLYKSKCDTVLVYGYDIVNKTTTGFVQISFDSGKTSLSKFLVDLEVI